MDTATNFSIWFFIYICSLLLWFGPHQSISLLNIEKNTQVFPHPPPPTPPTSTLQQPSMFIQCPPCHCKEIQSPSLRRQCISENDNRPLIRISQSLLTIPDPHSPSPSPSPSPPLSLLPSPSISPPSTARWKLWFFIVFVMGFCSNNIRSVVLKFPNLGEHLRLIITILITLLFHALFSVYGEPTANFIAFISLSCLIISILKFLQPHDATFITEDLGMSFLKFGLEYVIKEKKNNQPVIKGPVHELFLENFIAHVVSLKGEVKPYIDSMTGWVKKKLYAVGNGIKKMLSAFGMGVQAAFKKN